MTTHSGSERIVDELRRNDARLQQALITMLQAQAEMIQRQAEADAAIAKGMRRLDVVELKLDQLIAALANLPDAIEKRIGSEHRGRRS